MKKVYLLAALLAFSSGAFAHPCNPEDKDYDPKKCRVDDKPDLPDERPPVDWDKIPGIPFPEPWKPLDPRDPRGNPFVPGVGNSQGGF